MTPPVRVPDIQVMDDETVMLHLENRHKNELAMEFLPEPGREDRRLHAPQEWRTYHEALHRLAIADQYDHTHNEASNA
jgi:hypothetical protein